jgi:hypothetical protein
MDTKRIPLTGEIWKHYKHDDPYMIMTLARFELGLEIAVVYRSINNGKIWVRSLEDFLGYVESGCPRFLRSS